MKLNGRGYYISNEVIQGKQATYFYIKVCDEGNGEMRIRTEQPVHFNKFSKIEFEIDVVQGQYPKYNLVSIKEVK